MKFILLMVGVLLLAACGSVPETYEDIDLLDEEKVADDTVVMTINDEEIVGSTYNDVYLQIKTRILRKDADATVDEAAIREETLETITNNTLFVQLAAENGIVMDDSTIDADMKQLKKLDETGYRELTDKYNFTEAAIANQIKLEKIRKQYIDEFITVTVTEEEVRQFYDETVAATEEDLPDFDSAYNVLVETLEVQKAIEEVSAHIENYKGTSEINVHL